MDAAVTAAEAAHRQELRTIKAAALVNLAYLQLQQQQWQQAVAYSQQLLQVTAVTAPCMHAACAEMGWYWW